MAILVNTQSIHTKFSIDLHVVCATNKCTKHKIGDMHIVIKQIFYIINHIGLKVDIA